MQKKDATTKTKQKAKHHKNEDEKHKHKERPMRGEEGPRPKERGVDENENFLGLSPILILRSFSFLLFALNLQ